MIADVFRSRLHQAKKKAQGRQPWAFFDVLRTLLRFQQEWDNVSVVRFPERIDYSLGFFFEQIIILSFSANVTDICRAGNFREIVTVIRYDL